MADLGFFLRWSLRNLNYTKFNKETNWIYQCHKKKKHKKKNMPIHEILQFFCTNKDKRKKNRLIKDKVQIEIANRRIIRWSQQFNTKYYTTSC